MELKDLLVNKLQGELRVPFRHYDESARNRKRAETEHVQPIAMIKWHWYQHHWNTTVSWRLEQEPWRSSANTGKSNKGVTNRRDRLV